jgi:NAD(P)-dependent dehydrogenase (short-subunit alcohol dehydrogenase family)
MDTRKAFLTDRVALVSGAGAGIGKGIALAFASFGARVAALDVQAESAERTAAEIEAGGGRAIALAADAREGAAWARAVAATLDRLGGIDILVNNVGGTFRAAFADVSENGWDALLRVNLKSVFHGVRAVVPHLAAQGRGGSIINVVSIEAVRAAPLYAPYAACKAAVVNFTRSMALELAPQRIRVNALAPDICLTEGLASMSTDADRRRYDAIVPLGRPGVPEDVAGAAVFLASDLASYVTGITLHVDGGTWAAGGWYRDEAGGWVLGPPRPGGG